MPECECIYHGVGIIHCGLGIKLVQHFFDPFGCLGNVHQPIQGKYTQENRHEQTQKPITQECEEDIQ